MMHSFQMQQETMDQRLAEQFCGTSSGFDPSHQYFGHEYQRLYQKATDAQLGCGSWPQVTLPATPDMSSHRAAFAMPPYISDGALYLQSCHPLQYRQRLQRHRQLRQRQHQHHRRLSSYPRQSQLPSQPPGASLNQPQQPQAQPYNFPYFPQYQTPSFEEAYRFQGQPAMTMPQGFYYPFNANTHSIQYIAPYLEPPVYQEQVWLSPGAKTFVGRLQLQEPPAITEQERKALDEIFSDVRNDVKGTLREIFNAIGKGKLVEAKLYLVTATRWLTKHYTKLGLTVDPDCRKPEGYRELDAKDMKAIGDETTFWKLFNQCWLALFTRQYEYVREVRKNPDFKPPELLDQPMMEELGERAQFLAAHLVTPGLVDYQHGFWEEAIFTAWKRCAESMEIEQLVAQAQDAEDKLKSKKADQQ